MTAGAEAGRGDVPLLAVRDLQKRFRVRDRAACGRVHHVDAVAGVDLDVNRGETLCLVGESGSGKTTLGRAIVRLVEPSGGEVRFDGIDVGGLGREALRRLRTRMQIVFQDPFASLNPRMRAGAALAEALAEHAPGRDGERPDVAELLERVGLARDYADRFPHELSGGERQRVAIARALAVGPELLVLDEPVSALDVSVQAQIVRLLQDLQEHLGLTYLLIAHDLALVESVADRVAVMYRGRIVESAPAAELYRAPRHPYTRALLSAALRADGARSPGVEGLPLAVEPAETQLAARGCPFHPRCPHPLKDAACTDAVPPLESKAPEHFAACIKAPSGAPDGA